MTYGTVNSNDGVLTRCGDTMGNSLLRTTKLLYFLGIILFAGAYFVRNQRYSIDDSFITFRYAYHLMHGFGLVFNVGESYYGTTAAGYAVILAAVSRAIDAISGTARTGESIVSIQSVSVAISAFSYCVVAACLPFAAQAGRNGLRWALCAFFAAYLFVGFPFNAVPGHETYPFLALALLATVLAESGQSGWAGCLLGIATTFRPDTVLLAPILISMDWMRCGTGLKDFLKARDFKQFCLGYTLILLPWLTFLFLHFGRIIPGTMDAKRAQVAMGYWALYNPITLFNYFKALDIIVLIIGAIGLLAVTGAVVKLRDLKLIFRERELYLATTWLFFGVGSACAYFSMNVTFWYWYGIPVFFSLGVASFIGWRIILDFCGAASEQMSVTKWCGLAVSALPLIFMTALSLREPDAFLAWLVGPSRDWAHIHAYTEIADYLKRAEPAGTSIQMAEPGSFAFYLGPKYKVIDELGLISPGVAKAYLAGDRDFADRTFRAKYLICSWDGSYSRCSKPALSSDFELIGEFNVNFWRKEIGHGARLYRRVDSAT